MVEFQELRTFLAVAQRLNFARAAKDLGTSSPNVSKVIAQLEYKLERKLFLRTTRSVHLSEEGKQYLLAAAHAVEVLQEASDVFQKSDSKKLSGKIRITAPQTLMFRLLSCKLAEFHKNFPHIEVDLVLSDQYLDLQQENIDIAFRIMDRKDSALRAIKLAANPIVLCASPKYLKEHPKISSLADLRNHSILVIETHLPLRFKNSGARLLDLGKTGWIRSSNGDILVAQAKRGQGLLVRSRWGVQQELDSGELQELFVGDELLSDTDIYLVYHENRFMPQRVRSFIEFMRSSFQQAKV